MLNTREVSLGSLNSATKYPSIPTYHALGERGALLDQHVDFRGEPLIYTEKVDGTNTRIIVMPDGHYLIGSREELLHARGDLIHNPALGIVDAVRDVAERLTSSSCRTGRQILVYYLETYGGRITGASKNYTGPAQVSFRLLDVCEVDLATLDLPRSKISLWRESGGQAYAGEASLRQHAEDARLQVTPRLSPDSQLPQSIEAVYEWLNTTIPQTLVALDDSARGKPEGVVVRTPDRSLIAKVRFDDYRRHIKRSGKN
jgi:hypothetical protein